MLQQADPIPQDHVAPVHRFLRFLGLQAKAAIFGILLLTAIIASRLWWPEAAPLARYDALVIFAVTTQVVLLATRLETWEEAAVILLFHASGTAMEVFKLSQGSWDYPDQGLLEIGGVPLFTGFMYAAVGSYIARSLHLFNIVITPYPPFWMTVVLGLLIYGNFYAHHFLPDIRVLLFAGTLALFWRSRLHWSLDGRSGRIRLPLAALLVALLVWVAENVGTFTQTWTYAGQGEFDVVSLKMLGSWYLLIHFAFVTVTLVTRDALGPTANLPDEGAVNHRGKR
ncbi:DUF817 family protein [Rhodobacterales bacterium HKCCE3408]|nr:DUF817 family protein [Rhodobacterales bacterium HKCCE3408]